MERHPSASSTGMGTWDAPPVSNLATADRSRATFEVDSRTERPPSERSLALVSVSPWTHTIVLTGELNHRSAYTLEVEIERLCEEGVTGLTLDLRELTQIDSVGVAVIAFRRGLCERRGYDFAVIPGPESIRRVFAQAGVDDSPASDQDQVTVVRPRALALARSRDEC
jgi:anti-anti-sigma factor